MTPLSNDPLHLLLVEDSHADQRLFHENLKALPLPLPIQLDIVQDGDEALAFLRQQAPYTKAQRPHFIFLDMYLPRTTGFEVLGELERDPGLTTIPVVACVGSTITKEALKSYRLPADCYFLKGYDPEELLRILIHCQAHATVAA
jgi:two-component system, chemotaxis family, response regulator Rcp1